MAKAFLINFEQFLSSTQELWHTVYLLLIAAPLILVRYSFGSSHLRQLYKCEYSATPILYRDAVLSSTWIVKCPGYFKQLLRLAVNFFPSSWTRWLKLLEESDRITFGIWVRPRADHVSEALVPWSLPSDYPYKRVSAEAIRLFRIQPETSFDAPLHADNFEAIPFAQLPPYIALSYVWGDHQKPRTIFLAGFGHAITRNLDGFLRHLRAAGCREYLWCDAISINQTDDPEKSKQVAIMDSIFRQASQVVAWFGPELPNTNAGLGLQTLDYLLNGRGPLDDAPWEIRDPALVAAGLDTVLSNAWFTRYWTVQEVALARNVRVMLGQRSITWTNDVALLRRAIRRSKFAEITPSWQTARMPDLGHWLDILILQYEQVAEQVETFDSDSVTASTVVDIMHRVHKSKRKASDPRDQIFALLPLARYGRANLPKPDYNKSLDQLYSELFRATDLDALW